MAMNKTLMKLVSKIHTSLFKMSGGRLTGKMQGSDVVLLTTTGRKSGRRRTAPLFYQPDGDNVVVIASQGGHDDHPAWYLNLQADPEAEVQIGGETRNVRAETVEGEERDRLWTLMTGMYAGFDEYQANTKRRIPLVLLRPS